MIKEKSNGVNEFVLIPAFLNVGEQYEKYCIVSKCKLKIDQFGQSYLQFVLKGKEGVPIFGRLFDQTIIKNIKNHNYFIGKVVLISFRVDNVFGKKSLNIDWIVSPTDEDTSMKGIKIDLFDAILPDIDNLVRDLKDVYCTYDSVFTKSLETLFSHSIFTNLLYKSDESICLGKCGYAYLIFDMTWNRLLQYYKSGWLRRDKMSLMMSAQLLVECVILNVDSSSHNFHYNVFTNISKLMNLANVGTETEKTNLEKIITGYTDLRMGIPCNNDDYDLSSILYREYKNVYDNLASFTLQHSIITD